MRREIRKRWFLRLQTVFGAFFLLSVVWAGRLLWEQYRQEMQVQDLLAIHTAGRTEGEEAAAEEQTEELPRNLSEINRDYLGWLTVYGTDTALPVVLGEDNAYYLDHDFYGKDSSYGCLFADYRTQPEQDGNLLIYGHHMKNGSMFGSLERFKEKEFFREHGLVRWEQGEDSAWYEIFAVLVIPGYEEDEEYFPVDSYINRIDGDKTEELTVGLESRALLWRGVELSESDRFLFLLTCDYTRTDGRLLLCGKKIR
ncbi:MAG: class B sortase [Clostridiales bacterium]|nr:class B sortase [Clostridiales bacterium]